MPCGKIFGYMRFDRPVLVQGRVQDPEFDACGAHSPQRYNRVGVPCLVSRVRNADVATDVLGPVYWVLCLVRESGVRTWQPTCWVRGSGFKVHSRSLLKKMWSDARAAGNLGIHKQGESTRLKIIIP